MKRFNSFSKVIKITFKSILLIFYTIFKIIVYIPNIIISKLKSSISFKISAVYFKIMFRMFLWVLVLFIMLIGYYKISNIVNANIEGVSSIVSKQYTNVAQLINNLEKNQYSFSVYNKSGSIHRTNTFEDKLYLDYKIPFIISGNNYYFITSSIYNTSNSTYTILLYHNISQIIYEIAYMSLIIILVTCLGILLTLFFGIPANRKVLHPIREMTQTVKNISAQNLTLRISVADSKDELKELTRAFNEMMNEIEDAYTKQQQFVSDASHELRTPISVIQGYANMLNRWGKNDPKVMQESIDAIINESDNMKDLVEKLLFIARNDKNTLKLNVEEFNLNELILEVQKETEMIDNNHMYECFLDNVLLVSADKNSIKQVLRIIIDNAIKYTPSQGKIILKTTVEDGYAIISIADTGIGISKDELTHIFDRLYRSDKSRTKEKAGHGLGLYIAKIIVLRHKGKIKVKSKENLGTEFQVYLPLIKVI